MALSNSDHGSVSNVVLESRTGLASAGSTRLPTFRFPRNDRDGFVKIPLMKSSEIQSPAALNLTKLHHCMELWATVLRNYVLCEVVTFEVLEQPTSGTHLSSSAVSHAESQVAICRWSSAVNGNGSNVERDIPSITIEGSDSLNMLGNLPNTAISMAVDMSSMRPHIDYMLMIDSAGASYLISLAIRKSKVSEAFGRAVGVTFTQLAHALAQVQGDWFKLSPWDLSNADIDRLLEFTGSPLTQHQTCMHQLVEAVTARSPRSEAVHAWDGSLTYEQLKVHSDLLASNLIVQGVKHGQYVPFAFEKSMWSVITVLAILKAGAAFVPIEPTQPLGRTEEMLRDIDARIMVTSASLHDTYQSSVHSIVVVPESIVSINSSQLGTYKTALPQVNPQDAAFLLFTSGSTGKPKGMIMQHAAYSTHTLCHGRAMGYQNARVLQFAAHTFDVYAMDVFATLAYGGCICIPNESERRFDVVKAFNDYAIDLAILTPSFAHVLDPSALPNLKILAVGGEALKTETVRKWSEESQASLIQIYGPAEVGICILGKIAGPNPSPETIGYPLDNSLCLLVNPDDPERLVPVGAVGELVVAGPTMLREYINNPEKTQSCFLENPKWVSQLRLSQHRFYRTGDLLRYNVERMDGSFDFVGRRDSQIKYHGQRMELEDIEHHLSSIDCVSACMVSVPKEGVLAGRLVAVVQFESPDKMHVKHDKSIALVTNHAITVEDIRKHLSERVPAYMIPNALLVVENLPLTPSLKLNRPKINEWIVKMGDDKVFAGLTDKLCCDTLRPHEETAQTISLEYAKLVGGSDQRHRSIFEAHDFCLQAGGINSIQIILLHNFVQRTWKVKLPMSLILSSWVRVRDLAAIVDQGASHVDLAPDDTAFSIEMEATQLVRELVMRRQQPGAIKNILLTGATGYLGTEIARQLLQQGLNVFAIVRDKSVLSGKERLVKAGKAGGWWDEAYTSQVEVWLGNLSQPHLGLNNAHMSRILGRCAPHESIHAIIHNGAKVHYGLDYTSLKSTNVQSTIGLLELTAAAGSNLRSFVFVSGGQPPTFSQTSELPDITREYGYARSKLVAEAVVRKCMTQPHFAGKHLRVIRPGYIIGNSDDGRANTTDFLWRLIASCVEVGGYNADDADRWLFVADRKRVASMVIGCAVQPSTSTSTVNVFDGLSFTDLWHILSNEFCFTLKPLPQTEWLHLVRDRVAAKQDLHVMYPLMHLLEQNESLGSPGTPSSASAGVADAIRANVRYLVKIGYLPATVKRATNGYNTPGSEDDNA